MPTLPVSPPDGESGPEYVPTTYHATLTGPLFYSSNEGRVIETQTTISATALMHALGYTLRDIDLKKRYVQHGDTATETDYSHLEPLSLVATDMTPISADVGERTIKNTPQAESKFITDEESIAEQLPNRSNEAYPDRLGVVTAGWKRYREFMGVSPGSTYRFTLWTPGGMSLPDELRFRMGIKRTGTFTATKADTLSETVTLNAFLMSTVYDDPVPPANILANGDSYQKGNDPRLTHYRDVDREWLDDTLFNHTGQSSSATEQTSLTSTTNQ
jgi:CRISPR-associated protein Csc1